MRVPLLRGLTAALFFLASHLAPAGATTRDAVVERVIDGDTFVIAGGARVRVRNFDTPELRRYACLEERELARAARSAADAILRGQRVRLRVDGEDRYRRLVADVVVRRGPREIDFVEAMLAEGHGARWDYGAEPQPEWCHEPALEARAAAQDPPAPSPEVLSPGPIVNLPAHLRTEPEPTPAEPDWEEVGRALDAALRAVGVR